MYTSSLSDIEWNMTEVILHSHGISDSGRKHPLRTIVDAISYVVDNGVKWRNLPADFPCWPSVYYNFKKWVDIGLWEEINHSLVMFARDANGRDENPSLASIDSQSQSAEPGVQERGLDGGKKVNGRKKHLAVDVLGLVLLCICGKANESDRHAGEILAKRLNNKKDFPRLSKILGDLAYTNVGISQKVPVCTDESWNRTKTKQKAGFVPERFRWVVERTFAWLNRQRRLVRNYEKSTSVQEAMNYIGNIRICLRKIKKAFLC